MQRGSSERGEGGGIGPAGKVTIIVIMIVMVMTFIIMMVMIVTYIMTKMVFSGTLTGGMLNRCRWFLRGGGCFALHTAIGQPYDDDDVDVWGDLNNH